MDKTEFSAQMFELVSYMAVSARNLLEEPARYGPFRLVDAASRLVDILKQHGLENEALLRVQAKIDAGKYDAMGTEDAYEQFLESVVELLVAEIEPGLED